MPDPISRREFTESLGLAALGPLFAAVEPARAAPVRAAPARSAAEGARAAAPLASPDPDPKALARALAEVVRVQHGARLTPQELGTVTRQIEASLERSERIRRVELANGDEPHPVFAALRLEGP